MNSSKQWWTCRFCEYHQDLWYADGHMSFRCIHPANDPRTTRDIAILPACPKEQDAQLNSTGEVKRC